MLVYVIRHGETFANVEGTFQGRANGRLTADGVELARETGAALAKMGVSFDAAFSSPLTRALGTARLVLGACSPEAPLYSDARLAEVDMGDYEGRPFRPGEGEVDQELVRLFFEGPFRFPGFPGGECIKDVIQRTKGFAASLTTGAFGEFGTVLVSTHGCALRAMLNWLYDTPSDFWQGRVPYNCSVSILEADADRGVRLLEMDRIYYDAARCVDRYARY